ncbi:TlpA family protein disulfide reductase [Solitalea canadensis]|uniref:Thiol-disulfide isomerase-like thioredoxin n=1 Tax=Solitalea canadensis (strain ATCC 29591 / DSM 3403 / JCM 21819 / LMG 8368 / NBRC 15130 / NCIMB 12057 / USAM 9D) TaxID=929556 RepID=H8KRD9_SOLCM|nr:TlpA disulfide reductase family protein [Solitalea canadensis]AFD07464.1 thiol-disulfide isomerase-like thioredoxin [Solitalea canadensis DSM 3403]
MRKLLLGIVIILLGTCTTYAQQQATISGKIDSLKNNKLFLYRKDLIGTMTFSVDTIAVLADGSFNKTISLSEAAYCTLTSTEKGKFGVTRTQLFLAPGYELKITGKAKFGTLYLDNVSFSGIGADANTYLQQKQQQFFFNSTDFYSIRFVSMLGGFKGKNAEGENYSLLQKGNTQAFLQQPKVYNDTVTKYYSAQRVMLNEFAKKADAKYFDDFKKAELAAINYGEADAKLMYESQHNDYAKHMKIEEVQVDKDWYGFLTPAIVRSEANEIAAEPYRLFMVNYYNYLVGKKDSNAETTWTGVCGDIVRASSLFEKNEAYKRTITKEQFAEVEALLSKSLAVATKSSLFEPVKKQLLSLREYLNEFGAGKVAYNFNAIDINGKPIKLSDYKGKVVYMDVWASWCKPCVGEIPFGRTLEEKYKDRKDIIFITVSIDKKTDDWKSGLQKNNPAGTPLYVEGAFGGLFAKSYGINSIPRFVIIDKNGKFIDANAPRPSATQAIEAALNKALGI